MKRIYVAAAATATLLVLAGCSSEPAADPAASNGANQTVLQSAEKLVKLTSPHAETGGTLLEGPTIGEGGRLYVVDVMAPAGEPKLLRVDVEKGTSNTVYTDDHSAFTSAQFSPTNGRIYLTDIVSGSVVSMTSEGEDVRSEFTGEVAGLRMMPDDLSFDDDGNMFVTDTTGMQGPGWDTPGRVVRIGSDGAATVIADDLPSPNGISFDADGAGLYVAQYNANRIDYYGLDASGENVVSAYPAMHVNAGQARVDSTAVDAAGNVYQAFHGKPEIAVFAPTGELIQTVTASGKGLESATNIAISPGTTKGYITVSGPAGGFIYTFDALAEGIRPSNGG